MPSYQQFKLPDVGEGLTEADIAEWRVRAGDTVTVNQVLVEIETAKSLVELPCPFDGVVSKLLVQEGDTVKVGQALLTIDDRSSAPGTRIAEAQLRLLEQNARESGPVLYFEAGNRAPRRKRCS